MGQVPGSQGDQTSLTPGQILAERYEIRSPLGAGGMGQVFAAFDRVRQEDVALKVLLPHLVPDPHARDRFLNEARIATSLAHPSVVRVYDIHETVDRTFLTMELLQGRTLRQEIVCRQATSKRFSVEEVGHIAKQLCEALQYAHRHTVHRDIKPENIWLCEDGTVKVMDFGIAAVAAQPVHEHGFGVGDGVLHRAGAVRGSGGGPERRPVRGVCGAL